MSLGTKFSMLFQMKSVPQAEWWNSLSSLHTFPLRKNLCTTEPKLGAKRAQSENTTLWMVRHWGMVSVPGILSFPLLEWNIQTLSKLGWKKSGPHYSQPAHIIVPPLKEWRLGGGRYHQSSWLCLCGINFCNTELGVRNAGSYPCQGETTTPEWELGEEPYLLPTSSPHLPK